MAVCVWCQSCKMVVWAYDHQPYVDLRGICNLLCLPCPKCGVEGNFDGWGCNRPVEAAKVLETQTRPVYDDWSAMKAAAEYSCPGTAWEPSPDNRWFSRPVARIVRTARLCDEVV